MEKIPSQIKEIKAFLSAKTFIELLELEISTNSDNRRNGKSTHNTRMLRQIAKAKFAKQFGGES